MIDPTLAVLLFLLPIKHYLADYHWQTLWMIEGKRRYGAPGGLAHAGVHGALTVPVLLLAGIGVGWALALAATEAVLHYHIDWLKKRGDLAGTPGPESKAYWRAFGLDQTAHYLTYAAMTLLCMAVLAPVAS
ncbi:uncharacterized protein DUF3307 [Aliiruegeria haliotis]|uniref:Uncharacterized protein DUF3307 n=1 Tax=Aliiruegeria haliotis TaxID=1280846 RepID=A0A2T0RYA8_9RHOB|nr:DUF3307 domain-containing protein [Aliiruegeria haliotis]PRY26122.1 uncharacterized protein DUF3307 [Aliiruegeria haliotis]